ncbi:MAG TPA: hypothetical protein VF103_05105 [Polyangiaceae bacterium]
MRIWHFPALAGVFLVAGACSGTSSIGGEEPETGGTAGDMGGGGGVGGSSGKSGKGGTGGSAGTGMLGGTGGTTPNPCAGKPCGAECSVCGLGIGDPATGGTNMGAAIPCDTAVRYCDASGQCNVPFPVCDNECETTNDCAAVDAVCQVCADGTVQCPSVECQMGRCISTYPSCESQCMSDSDCGVIAAPCQMCPDGTASCPKSECVSGRCSTGWPGCGGVDPCDGKSCGDACNPCGNAMGCPVPDIIFACNSEGKCAAGVPTCGTECMSSNDCPQLELCYMCAGGTCGNNECVNGSCQWVCPKVEPPRCMSDTDCDVGDICRYCPDMSCAEIACLNGECKSVCPL